MTERERVSVRWFKPIRYDDLNNWEGDYYDVLYVVTKMRKPVYIGMAYRQTVNQRLANNKTLKRIAKIEGLRGLSVAFGERIVKEGKRLSEKRVRAIENLLIYTYKPKHNKRGKKTYRGRPLIIDNGGPGNPFDKVVTTSKVNSAEWIRK